MESVSMKCLGEYLSDKTLGIVTINATQKTINVRCFDPNGNTIVMKENISETKFSFTSEDSGNHQICIENTGPASIRIDFEFIFGIAAKDYSNVAKKKNLSPIEVNLEKLEDMMVYLRHILKSIMDSDERTNYNENDYLTKNIIFFSLILIIITIISGIIETLFLKRYFRHRKLI